MNNPDSLLSFTPQRIHLKTHKTKTPSLLLPWGNCLEAMWEPEIKTQHGISKEGKIKLEKRRTSKVKFLLLLGFPLET